MRFLLIFCVSVAFMFGVERPKFEDFAACFQRNKASVMVYEGMNAFVLSENLLAVLKTPSQKLNRYIKYDPFLNLYLVRTDFSLFPAVTYDEQNLTRNDWVGIIDPNTPYIGHLKYLAQNITERDQLDFTTKVGQLNTPCCSMLGISLADGSFIGNRYLKHFAKYNDVYWGDIGVDFVLRDDKIYVESVRNNGKFLINDEVVSVDDIAVNDLRKLNEKILFADRGSTLYFKVLRDNKDVNISTNVFAKSLPAGFNPATIADANATKAPARRVVPQANQFRSALGFSLDNSLNITRVEAGSKASQAGFAVGDRLLRIDNQVVRDLRTAQRILGAGNDFNILVERSVKNLPINPQSRAKGDGTFQFFIRLSK